MSLREVGNRFSNLIVTSSPDHHMSRYCSRRGTMLSRWSPLVRMYICDINEWISFLSRDQSARLGRYQMCIRHSLYQCYHCYEMRSQHTIPGDEICDRF